MNKRQKEVQQSFLDNEKDVLKKIEQNYKDALSEINSKIEILMSRQDADMQHVIYQIEYQKALKSQVQAILDTLHANEFETVSEYLTKSYEDGFIGTMYDLQGQGIPLIMPLDQEQVVAAVQNETKLSESLYTSLGKDIKTLNKKIAGEISRGISSGQMYSEIARNIAGWARIPQNNAMRIARTESHRIQCKATADAQFKAKEKGADIVKQWDSALDRKTRKSHRELDGQIRELDEPFEVNGHKAMQPGGFGIPKEDINCRCALLQRARWNLDSDYTKWSEEAPVIIDDDGTTQFAIIESKNYKDFQKKYKHATERVRDNVQKMNNVVYEIDDMSEKSQQKVKDCYDELTKEYNTPLKRVIHGVQEKGTKGDTDILGEEIRLNTSNYQTMAHEFFHTLASTKRDKAGLSDDSEFWKEIKEVRKEYYKAIENNLTKRISAYADKNIDEFTAECFGQVKSIEGGHKMSWEIGTDTTYSKKIVDIIDKYFKK